MAGKKGRSGSGGKRKGAGRPKGAVDAQPRFRIAKSLAVPKLEFAKKAQRYADRMLDVLVAVANNVEAPEAARVSAAAKVLDRVLGSGACRRLRLASHRNRVPVGRAVRQELINRGVPEVFAHRGDQTGADQPRCARSFIGLLAEGCER